MDKKFIFRNSVLTLFALLITAIVFIVDLNVDSSLTVSGMYVVIILYVFILQWKYVSIVFGLLIALLIIIDYNQSEIKDQAQSINFMISMSGLWVAVILVNLAHRGFDFVDSFQKNLEKEVKKRTSEIKRYESKIRMMTNEIKDQAFILVNHMGIIETWNIGAQYIFGYPEKSALSMNFKQLLNDSNNSSPTYTELSEIKKNTVFKLWLKRNDGTSFYARISVNPIKFGKTISAYTLIINDLSDVRALELETKNKELESFAHIVAHDLKAPVNTITGLVDLVQAENNKDPKAKESVYITKIKDSAERMNTLISGILQYAQLGEIESFKKLNIMAILSEIEDDLKSEIDKTKADLKIVKLPSIIGNELEIRLLFQNLISNAIKFSIENRPPKIRISAKEKPDHWEFSVSDNGKGIPEKMQKDIFRIFYRSPDNKNIEGSGIGLSNCKKIVTLHRGDIWVDSAINTGTTFYFTISKHLQD
ncbi:PAS domain-containing protein [Hyphobacterium sp. CCMP332]|nr:PAS domain-containing protein [Hyphobacterium sp. CCMP332]